MYEDPSLASICAMEQLFCENLFAVVFSLDCGVDFARNTQNVPKIILGKVGKKLPPNRSNLIHCDTIGLLPVEFLKRVKARITDLMKQQKSNLKQNGFKAKPF